jgi:hypothetical protein
LLGTKNPENHIPKEFLRVKYEVDTDKVRDALAEGQELGWATLGERGDHLRIK